MKKTDPNEVINAYVNGDGETYGGLTKREYFASMAMSTFAGMKEFTNSDIAEMSIELADKLIERLSDEI